MVAEFEVILDSAPVLTDIEAAPEVVKVTVLP
jgi:hypothetical protein